MSLCEKTKRKEKEKLMFGFGILYFVISKKMMDERKRCCCSFLRALGEQEMLA